MLHARMATYHDAVVKSEKCRCIKVRLVGGEIAERHQMEGLDALPQPVVRLFRRIHP